MTQKPKDLFDREEAETIAEEIYLTYLPFWKEIRIVGSIRREKEKVHDIDIVMLPNDWIRLEAKIIKGNIKGIPFDIYIANEKTFETLVLIRTGSAEHNQMLCKKAIEKGWKLKADGTGLVDKDGNIIDNTERGILEKLLGRYVEPRDREVVQNGLKNFVK